MLVTSLELDLRSIRIRLHLTAVDTRVDLLAVGIPLDLRAVRVRLDHDAVGVRLNARAVRQDFDFHLGHITPSRYPYPVIVLLDFRPIVQRFHQPHLLRLKRLPQTHPLPVLVDGLRRLYHFPHTPRKRSRHVART